jgi:hypothetical protein
VYGYESRFRNILVFAFAISHRQDLSGAEAVLSAIREEHRIPATRPIHCRVLYNADACKKSGFDPIDQSMADGLVSAVVHRMRDIPAACKFAWTDLPERNPLVDSSDTALGAAERTEGYSGPVGASLLCGGPGWAGRAASESEKDICLFGFEEDPIPRKEQVSGSL